MYQQKYNYKGVAFVGFDAFLQSLWKNSLITYHNEVAHEATYFERVRAQQKIKEFINYLEDYVHGLIALSYVNENNICEVIAELKKLESISVLSKDKNNLCGETVGRKIFINSSIQPSKTLSSSERTRLYVGHEIGHLLHMMWEKDQDAYMNMLTNRTTLTKVYNQLPLENRVLIKEGFSMLDEAIVQNIAEDVAYLFARKERPPRTECSDRRIFDGMSYTSNFDFYQELQEPTVKFGRTLRSMDEFASDNEVLKELGRRSFEPGFVRSIVNDSIISEKNFLIMLLCMGRIKDASYSKFNYGYADDSLDLSSKYYDHFMMLCNKTIKRRLEDNLENSDNTGRGQARVLRRYL